MLDNTIYRTKSGAYCISSVESLINGWVAERERGTDRTKYQTFKPEERFKYVNVDRLGQLIKNMKS